MHAPEFTAAMRALPPTVGFRVDADGGVSVHDASREALELVTALLMENRMNTSTERKHVNIADEADPSGYWWADIVDRNSSEPKKRVICEVYGDRPFYRTRIAGEVCVLDSELRFICRVPSAESLRGRAFLPEESGA